METAEATSILIGADQGIVVEELERLKQKLGAGYELTVKWLPRKKAGDLRRSQGRLHPRLRRRRTKSTGDRKA